MHSPLFARLALVAAAVVAVLLFADAATAGAPSGGAVGGGSDSNSNVTLFAGFQFLNWTWPNSSAYDEWYTTRQGYKNCMLAGIKVSPVSGDVFVSVPRWKPDVPATLNRLVPTADGESYLLQPFPSWEQNAVGDAAALQSVLGFEIDALDRLWVLDQGKVNGSAAIPGSIKLLVFNLTDGGSEIARYVFPESQASLNNSFLNDIVVDQELGFGFITDSGLPVLGVTPGDTVRGGLLVYNLNNNTARRVLDADFSTQPDEQLWIHINGAPVLSAAPMRTGADGIAMPADCHTLFYCPLTSTSMFSLPTKMLRDFAVPLADIQDAVVPYQKLTSSDGLGYDNRGSLYVTSLQNSSVFTTADVTTAPQWRAIASDPENMQWPDTLAFDHRGSLLFVSNQLYRFVQGLLDFDTPGVVNFRIWKVWVDAGSYLDPPGSYAA